MGESPDTSTSSGGTKTSDKNPRMMSRRQMLKWLGATSAGALLAACQPQEVREAVGVEVEKIVEVEAQSVFPTEAGDLTILLCCSSPDSMENRERWKWGLGAGAPRRHRCPRHGAGWLELL